MSTLRHILIAGLALLMLALQLGTAEHAAAHVVGDGAGPAAAHHDHDETPEPESCAVCEAVLGEEDGEALPPALPLAPAPGTGFPSDTAAAPPARVLPATPSRAPPLRGPPA